MSIKKVYLHVGIHKTATSSIQDTLYNNRSLLEDEGYYYPKSWKANHSEIFFNLFADESLYKKLNIKKKIKLHKLYKNFIKKNKLINELKNKNINNLILSAESISLLNEKSLNNLKKFILNDLKIEEIKIIISLRDKIDYCSSAFQEIVKTGNNPENKDSILIEYKEKVEKFIKVFNKTNIIIYKFEDSYNIKNGPVGLFLEKINFNKRIDYILKSNESLSNMAVDLIFFINNELPFLNSKGKISNGREKADLNILFSLSGKKFTLDYTNHFCILDQQFEKDNKWLQDNFSIHYTKPEVLDKKSVLSFNQKYYDEILKIFPNLSMPLQKLTYKYLKNKLTVIKDDDNILILNKLIEWIETNYIFITQNKLEYLIKYLYKLNIKKYI